MSAENSSLSLSLSLSLSANGLNRVGHGLCQIHLCCWRWLYSRMLTADDVCSIISCRQRRGLTGTDEWPHDRTTKPLELLSAPMCVQRSCAKLSVEFCNLKVESRIIQRVPRFNTRNWRCLAVDQVRLPSLKVQRKYHFWLLFLLIIILKSDDSFCSYFIKSSLPVLQPGAQFDAVSLLRIFVDMLDL
jgi:hypothetical protein